MESSISNFIAIDFETANDKRISACSIGVAVYENNYLKKSFSEFIKPPVGEIFTNTYLHNICEADVESAVPFNELWDKKLKLLFENNLIVLHNSSMDASILKQLREYYNLDMHVKYVDTMLIAKDCRLPGKLIELCNEFQIIFNNVHDAKEDAIVCGKVYIYLPEKEKTNKKYYKNIPEGIKEVKFNPFKTDISQKKIDKSNLNPDLENANPDDFFFNKKVVFTGDLKAIDRNEAAEIISKRGADVNTAISKKTNFVIVGNNAGPSKLAKIEELQKTGLDIKIIYEPEFLTLIGKQ